MDFENFHFTIDDNGVATVLMDRRDEPVNTLGVAFTTELGAVAERSEANASQVTPPPLRTLAQRQKQRWRTLPSARLTAK